MGSLLSPAEKDYIITGLSHPSKPTRLDGRALLASRSITVSYGDAPQASGSARVVLGGGTEVVAGIRLEVGDVDPKGKGKGKEEWRGRVDVDITPQAMPQTRPDDLSRLSTIYASILTEHFIPSIPSLPIVEPTKYFIPHLHVTLHASSSGNVLTALILAARAAFFDLRIPATKVISSTAPEDVAAEGDDDLMGIKAAVRAGRQRGRGKGRQSMRGADEWELDLEGEDLRLEGRESLPVVATLNLVPGAGVAFIDATLQEEIACPDRLQLFYNNAERICGARMEGNAGLDVGRIRPLLEQGKQVARELIAAMNADIPA